MRTLGAAAVKADSCFETVLELLVSQKRSSPHGIS